MLILEHANGNTHEILTEKLNNHLKCLTIPKLFTDFDAFD